MNATTESSAPPHESRFAVLVRKSGREARAREVLAAPASLREAFAVLEARAALGEADRRVLAELEQDLAAAFLLSPEAVELDSMSSYEHLFTVARAAFGRTVMTLTAAELVRAVFEELPRRVMLEREDARPLLADLRAFYMFLGRVFDLAHVPASLAALEDDAVPRLEEALASKDWSREKAILRAGEAAGFDMHTREGVEGFARHLAAQRDAAARAANSRAATARTKKAKRKASDHARRRNR